MIWILSGCIAFFLLYWFVEIFGEENGDEWDS